MKHVVKKYTVSGNTKQYVKVKGLTKTKKYYVKVRAYLKVGKKYYYSSYSAVVKNKPLKIKKKKQGLNFLNELIKYPDRRKYFKLTFYPDIFYLHYTEHSVIFIFFTVIPVSTTQRYCLI